MKTVLQSKKFKKRPSIKTALYIDSFLYTLYKIYKLVFIYLTSKNLSVIVDANVTSPGEGLKITT